MVAAILKRLAHRNPNVQLYTLSLAESLSKNLGVEVHREIASKAFTQGLERIVTDRVSPRDTPSYEVPMLMCGARTHMTRSGARQQGSLRCGYTISRRIPHWV